MSMLQPQVKRNLRTRWKGLLDRIQVRLFVRGRSSDQASLTTSRIKRESFAVKVVRRLFIGFFGIGLLSGFVGTFYYYSNTLSRLTSHPDVTNLASPVFSSRIKIGISPECADTFGQKQECWILNDFDDSSWTIAGLPKFDLRQQIGFKENVGKNSIYYRLNIPIPPKLRASSDVISFSPGWVNHRFFQVFISGRQVFEGAGTTIKDALVVIPIPRQDRQKNTVEIVIKASLSNSDVGIHHHGGLYIGPKHVLDELYVSEERINTTYFLLILFSKGSVFIIFALFFFFTKAQRGFFHFLIYALCVTLENVILLAESYLDFNQRVLFYFTVKVIAVHALQRFFAAHYEIHRVKNSLNILGFLQIALIVVMAVDQAWGSKTVTIGNLLAVSNYFLLATLAVTIFIGLVNIRRYNRLDVSEEMRSSLREFLMFVTIYFGLLIWEIFFNEYLGLDKRAIFDLFFFYYMALVSARNTGFNEGKIVTLEAHMEEKKRMERELQEAAEIAKAFLPASVPHWDFCDIAVHHKSITESSGDWFSFEEAPSGNFYHCVVCDITGHGVQAALIVSTCKTVMSSLIASDPSLLERQDFLLHYIKALNVTLFKQGGGHHTATLIGMTFEPKASLVHSIAAGHPPAFLLQTAVEKPQVLISRNSVLGLRNEFSGQLKTYPFVAGSELVTYTDGLPINSHARGLGQLLKLKAGVRFSAQPKILYDDVWRLETARNKKQPDDDVSIIWFRKAS
jgi:hypothetical protein